MTEERRSRGYARRRDLRDASSAARDASGPTTQELVLYRDELSLDQHDEGFPPARPHRRDATLPARRAVAPLAPARSDGDRGERTRAFVERWSQWASGLGRPPRDASGRRPYAPGDRMLPPGLVIAAGLGIAALVGLLSGVLITGPRGAAAAASLPTVTVTQQVTPPAITETRTRTRTRTTTVTASPAPPAQDPAEVLRPGSQGPAVSQLQQDLTQLGLYAGPVNGSYDEATRAAVQNFQATAGVSDGEPGVAGPATLAALAKAVGRA